MTIYVVSVHLIKGSCSTQRTHSTGGCTWEHTMHSGGQEQHLQQRNRPPTKERKMKNTSTSNICHYHELILFCIVWEETQKLSKILIDIESEDKSQLRRKRRRQNDDTDDAPEAKRLKKEQYSVHDLVWLFSQLSLETPAEPMDEDWDTSMRGDASLSTLASAEAEYVLGQLEGTYSPSSIQLHWRGKMAVTTVSYSVAASASGQQSVGSSE